jgi:Secretion system C-terminal sorting domain
MDVEELASGKLLTSSTIGNFDDENLRISFQLFSASGAKETQFGTNGEIILNVEDKQSVICATNILPDGKILLAGGVFDAAEETFGAILTRLSFEYGVSTQEQTTLTASNLYPNPVNDFSTLSYELLENSLVNIQLYDLQGRMIQQILAPQMRSAGKQTESLEFNTALPTGQYLLKIDMADKGYKTLKMNKS